MGEKGREERRGRCRGEKRGQGRGKEMERVSDLSFTISIFISVNACRVCALIVSVSFAIFPLFASATLTKRLLTNGEIVDQSSSYPLGNFICILLSRKLHVDTENTVAVGSTSESHSQFHPLSLGTAMSPTPDLGKGPRETGQLKELREL